MPAASEYGKLAVRSGGGGGGAQRAGWLQPSERGQHDVGREAGYSQLARVPYASMAPVSAPDLQNIFSEAGLCLIQVSRI